MRHLSSWQRILSAAVAVVLTVPAFAKEVDKDEPNARREARDEWYNDNYGRGNGNPKKGGPFSAKFMKHLNDAAAKERAKYASELPGTGSVIAPTTDPTAAIA